MPYDRALLTDSEREHLQGLHNDPNREYYCQWELQNRIRDRLGEDLEIIAEHAPEEFEAIQQLVKEVDVTGEAQSEFFAEDQNKPEENSD